MCRCTLLHDCCTATQSSRSRRSLQPEFRIRTVVCPAGIEPAACGPEIGNLPFGLSALNSRNGALCRQIPPVLAQIAVKRRPVRGGRCRAGGRRISVIAGRGNSDCWPPVVPRSLRCIRRGYERSRVAPTFETLPKAAGASAVSGPPRAPAARPKAINTAIAFTLTGWTSR